MNIITKTRHVLIIGRILIARNFSNASVFHKQQKDCPIPNQSYHKKLQNIGEIYGSKYWFLCQAAIIATSAFGIATVILAVEKSDLKNDLEGCKNDTEPGEVTTTPRPVEMGDYRLPKTVIPKSYDLTLYPDLKTGLFKGKLIASVAVHQDVNQIKIHNHGLNVTHVDIDGTKATTEINKQYELLIITLADGASVKKGDRSVTIHYDGDMRNRIVGLYSSSYTNAKGQKRAIATSKFEPTYARQAFPCFDEPNMKATYTVHILKPKDDASYIALSNMPQLEKEDPEENGVMVHFQPSVKMSTYLSCFIVCDFLYKADTFNSGPEEKRAVPLRVYATPAQLDKTDYALRIAKGVIEYFVQYFNIDYPLPKLDLIAIPDFVSGAMEHWGLVTFRETALLFDKDISSSANQQRVATVVAHELAHSWFGNLVTMDWWNDLWLNEGFATYITYKGISIVEPTWEMVHQFLISDLHSVLSKDATPASHPIVQTVVTPDQITEIFDSITYSKGASLLRMLEGAVGEKNFQDGVTAYLNAHKWGNAITSDLLKELQKIVGNTIDVTTFMDTWTVQMGYPILTIKEEDSAYVITQKRFLKDPEDAGSVESPYGYKWTVPLTYITDKGQTKPVLVWFGHNQSEITIQKPADIKWIKFNHNQVGYYRVNYPRSMWETLAKNIGEMKSISDKTHLLEESFSIAESGDELDYDVPLDLTLYLKNEFNYIPWSVAATKLDKLKTYLIDSREYSSYLKYVINILTPAYKDLTWNEDIKDDHLRKRARITVLGLACEMGHAECKQNAHETFSAWLSKNEPIPQNLRSIVFSYGMVDSSETEWNKVLGKFKTESDANEKLNLLRGLASVKDPQLLRKLIDLGKDEDIIRAQDYFTMLQYVSANPIGTSLVWDYVRENWNYLVERFTLNDRYLGRLIPAITGSFTTATKLKEIEEFFSRYPESGAGAGAREEALANVRNNIKWIKTNKAKVEDWIRKNSKP